jgi:hypothetical protein
MIAKGKFLLLILLSVGLFSLSSCDKEDDVVPDMAGFLHIKIETNYNLDDLEMHYFEINPIENMDAELDFLWDDISKWDNTKTYKSKILLSGTYFVTYRLRVPKEGSSTEHNYSNYREHTIQIFPNDTTVIKGKF